MTYSIKENNQHLTIRGQAVTFRSAKKAQEFSQNYNKTFGKQTQPEKNHKNLNQLSMRLT